MARRVPLGVVVAVALAAVLVSMLWRPIPSLGQGQGNEVTIVALDKANDDRELPLLDAGRKGFSRGDLVVFVTPLLDPETEEKIGRLTPRCSIIRANRRGIDFSCNGVAELSGGDVAFEGKVRFGRDVAPSELAITGGTGIYENAGGTATVEETGRNVTTITLNIQTK